jgi:PAS domain S-box-containing protein
VRGITASIGQAVEQFGARMPVIQLGEDLSQDASLAFGVMEAARHRERGLQLDMFLSGMKCYAQTYQDYLSGSLTDPDQRRAAVRFVHGFFDRLELALVSEWVQHRSEDEVEQLRERIFEIGNEKKHYQTIFESLTSPALFIDREGVLRNWNHAAARVAGMEEGPGSDIYNEDAFPKRFSWLVREAGLFFASKKLSENFEEEVDCAQGKRIFHVSLQRSQDVTGHIEGTIALLTDLTRLRHTERRLSRLQAKLQRELDEKDAELLRLRAPQAPDPSN